MKIVLAIAATLLVVCSCAPSSAGVVPTAASTLPAVQIDSPANGHVGVLGETQEVRATGVDVQAGVTRIDLLVADLLVDSAATPANAPQPVFPAIFHWVPSTAGQAVVSVVAYRLDGTASAPVSIVVNVLSSRPTPGPSPTARPTPPPTPTPLPTPTAGPPTLTPTEEPTLMPTEEPTPTTAPSTPEPTPVSAVDLMPEQCRSRNSLVRLNGHDLDGDGASDSVIFGGCGPDGQGGQTFYGPVVRLSADESVAARRNGQILTGYGSPDDVIVLRRGADAAFVVIRLDGDAGQVAQLTVYGLIPAETAVDSVHDLPPSELWCSFAPLDGPAGRVGIVVTEVVAGSYVDESTRCETGTLASFAYEWRVRDLPAPGRQWPAPARRDL